MNAEDALAAIRDVEKPGDKGRKDGERRGQKRGRLDRRIRIIIASFTRIMATHKIVET